LTENRPDQPTSNPEHGAAADRAARPGARTEQADPTDDERAGPDADQRRGHGAPPAESEHDGKPPQRDDRGGEGLASRDQGDVPRAGIAFVQRNVLDATGFNPAWLINCNLRVHHKLFVMLSWAIPCDSPLDGSPRRTHHRIQYVVCDNWRQGS